MAIALRFNFIVARKVSIEAKYSGGVVQFRADFMKREKRHVRRQDRYGEDEHLVGFYSMGNYFSDALEKLIASGLQHRVDDSVIDIAFGDELNGIEEGCDWLEISDWDGHFESRDGFKVCWLKGSVPGDIVEAFFI